MVFIVLCFVVNLNLLILFVINKIMIRPDLTWKLLHTLAAKIKSENYDIMKLKFQMFIFNVFRSLQCPICKSHSLGYLMENPNIGDNKDEFIKYLFDFHTKINIKVQKKYYAFSRIVEYNDYNLSEINILWKNVNGHCPEYCLTFVDKNMGMFDNS